MTESSESALTAHEIQGFNPIEFNESENRLYGELRLQGFPLIEEINPLPVNFDLAEKEEFIKFSKLLKLISYQNYKSLLILPSDDDSVLPPIKPFEENAKGTYYRGFFTVFKYSDPTTNSPLNAVSSTPLSNLLTRNETLSDFLWRMMEASRNNLKAVTVNLIQEIFELAPTKFSEEIKEWREIQPEHLLAYSRGVYSYDLLLEFIENPIKPDETLHEYFVRRKLIYYDKYQELKALYSADEKGYPFLFDVDEYKKPGY